MSALSAVTQASALASASDADTKRKGPMSAVGGGGDKKKRKGKKKKDAVPKDMVLNERGELVTAKEYALQQTLDATNKSLTQYRERMEGLIAVNEGLQETCQQQEKDALDVIAALHAENEKKEGHIEALRQHMEAEAQRFANEQHNLITDYERKLSEMNAILNEKEAAFKVMQQEFSVIKDFRKKRHELIKELEYQKQELADTERRHKDTIARMERKFFEEKIRLQKEANRKISELATKAHKEAVANLGETTKEVFRENLRMAEALRYHVQEGEELTKSNMELAQTNRHLAEEKDLHDVIVKEKILQTKQQSHEIKDLQTKIVSMEHSLSHVVREFEHEREIIGRLARRELEEVRKVTAKLKDSLDRKTQEMKHIKRLAQHILDQRTDLERFFMDALEHVRSELQRDREASRKAAQAEYNRRMRAVLATKNVAFPAIQSFRPVAPKNINPATAAASILAAVEGGDHAKLNAPAPPPPPDQSKVDIRELSWVDKERVLRLLFARMNGVSLVGGDGRGQHHDGSDAGSESGMHHRGHMGLQSEGRMVDIDQESEDNYGESRFDDDGG
ncbi:hypothetical protein HK104_009431, partial [Borealophlyctis nickersoniae]